MRTTVNVPDELLEKAKIKAANERRLYSFSALVTILLEDYVKEEKV